MSDTPVEVKITQSQPPQQTTWEKIKRVFKSSVPETTLKESDRFTRMGYFRYPQREQLDFRLFTLMGILDEIETEQEKLGKTTEEDDREQIHKQIRLLFKAFTITGAPWFEGLDNRELAAKAVTFSKIEKIITDGNLTAYFPDLKTCAETLIRLSFQAKHVIPQPSILMETRMSQQAPYGAINLGDDNAKRTGKTEET